MVLLRDLSINEKQFKIGCDKLKCTEGYECAFGTCVAYGKSKIIWF